MIKKIIKLISHPQSEYKKIVPFSKQKCFTQTLKKLNAISAMSSVD